MVRDTSPRKRPKQKRSQETVNAILEATVRVLQEGGFGKASTNQIAKIAGVSIGSLYQYFPNKEALVMAVFEEHCEEMLELLRSFSQEWVEAPLEEAVPRYIRAMIRAHMVNPQLHKVLTQQVLHLGWDHLKHMQEAARFLVQEYLQGHQERIIPTDLRLASFVLVTSVESVIHTAILEPELELDVDALEGEICHLILRYLLGGA